MDYSKFTPSYKDNILKILVESFEPYRLCVTYQPLDSDFELLGVTLQQFQELGFIDNLTLKKSHCSLILQAKALDFLNSGGFTAEQYLKEAHLDKLLLELEKLNIDPKFKTLTPIISNTMGLISSTLSLFKVTIG